MKSSIYSEEMNKLKSIEFGPNGVALGVKLGLIALMYNIS